MSKMSFLDRLQLVAAGIDFLLSEPRLKFADKLLGLLMLRHTVLFGRLSDTMTRTRQSQGVARVNLGTGCSIRRLRTAFARLVEVRFITAEPSPNPNYGVTYTLHTGTLAAFTAQFRRKGLQEPGTPADCPPVGCVDNAERIQTPKLDQASPLGSAPIAAPDEVEAFQNQLYDLVTQLGFRSLGAPNRNTVVNLLRAARSRNRGATPEAVVWFIRGKLIDGGASRFRSWGGVVHALRNDYPAAPHGTVGAGTDYGQTHLRCELDRYSKLLDSLDRADPRRNAIQELIVELRRQLATKGGAA